MQLPIDRLFKGIIHAINEVILPELSSPYPRAQAMAMGSIFQNLMVRISNIEKLQLAQNSSLKEILRKAEGILSEYGNMFNEEDVKKLLREISQLLQKKYQTHNPLADENYTLKQQLEKIIDVLWSIQEENRNQSIKELHNLIRQFLRQEVEAEISLLTPIDMAGVSKGK